MSAPLLVNGEWRTWGWLALAFLKIIVGLTGALAAVVVLGILVLLFKLQQDID